METGNPKNYCLIKEDERMNKTKNLKLTATKDGWTVKGRKRKHNFYTNILDIILEEMTLSITFDKTFKRLVAALRDMKVGDTLTLNIHHDRIPQGELSFREYLIYMTDLARDKGGKNESTST